MAGALTSLLFFAFERTPKWQVILAFILITSGLLSSFGAGQFSGNFKKLYPSLTHVVTSTQGELEGTLIRSGESGILLYHRDTQQVTFIRWEPVKEITTKKPAKEDTGPWIFRLYRHLITPVPRENS
jgi:hypothetical protein